MRRCPKKNGKTQGRIGSDGSLACDDFPYAPLRNADLLGQPVLGNPQRPQEVLHKHFTRMRLTPAFTAFVRDDKKRIGQPQAGFSARMLAILVETTGRGRAFGSLLESTFSLAAEVALQPQRGVCGN